MEQLINQYGYFAILIGTFLEGETILVIAGFLSHRGYLELPWVITIAFTGTLIGDQLYFYIGRKKGRNFIRARPPWQRKSARIVALLNNHQTLLILGFRFLYGIRTITPFVLGASGISPIRYLILNIIGAAVWALTVGMLGYYFGFALAAIIDDVKKYEMYIILGVALSATLSWLWFNRRKHQK